MSPDCLECVNRIAKRHGSGFIVSALRKAAEAQLHDIEFSLASEERIAEQAEPWHETCDELNKL
jgi:hypothetical protein